MSMTKKEYRLHLARIVRSEMEILLTRVQMSVDSLSKMTDEEIADKAGLRAPLHVGENSSTWFQQPLDAAGRATVALGVLNMAHCKDLEAKAAKKNSD